MILETERLILCPWRETDAESLYEYAKSPLVDPMTGWPVHTSVENSLQIIQDVLSVNESYAVTIKDKDKDIAIGSVGLLTGSQSNLDIGSDEAEVGYWLGVPYWGQGLIPEAVRELMRHAFNDLNISVIWCGYFEENKKSEKVNKKCGFRFHHTEYNKEWPLINAFKTQHVTCISRQEWLMLFS